ncbi:protein SCAR3-like isoform X1 [Cicer arietinum]|uniref:Protein SCAR n=1 Tax=Cicer arietinum TaxID=3827 RepID=A0A1S2YGU0_CICAR|nr:protein SCAR1-like isoform X1 [Cicer arietinum]
MPLVRLQVRNEFGLGQPELYRETNREDPKAVLDGVAVAGLVGILRQLGDLADFAAEVFHGLQEQVMITAARSHRLMTRVQNIEASLPPLEKAVLAQTSHIHLAYTAGCEWHPRIRTARNHFIYNDLPHFIMDSYEECRDPPRVHLLDKFDTGGPGSCLRRYSDPTFFKRVSADSEERYSEKTEKARKSRKNKKRRSTSRRNGELLRGEQMHGNSGRMQFNSSSINGRASSHTNSTIDMTMKSDVEDRSNSFDSKSGAGYIECIFHPSNNSLQPKEQDCEEPSSPRLAQKTDTLPSVSPSIDDDISHDSLEKQIPSHSSGVTWDEKEEIVESNSQTCETDKTPERLVEKHDSDMHVNEPVSISNGIANIDYSDILFNEERNLKPVFGEIQADDDIDSEPDNDNFMDALNSIESESEVDLDYETKREVQQFASNVTLEMIENGDTEAPSNLSDNNLSDVVSQTGYTVHINKETGKDIPDLLQENSPLTPESYIPDIEKVTRDTVYSNEEAIQDLPDSLQEIPPLTFEPHASDFEPASPLDIPYHKETFGDFPDSLQEIPPLTLPEIPPLTLEPDESDLGYASPSNVSSSKEITTDVADSHSSESLISGRDPHTHENSVLDHSVGTHTSIGSPTDNDTTSASIRTDKSFSGSELPDERAGKVNNNCKYEDTRKESLSDNSVRFWTNGGLLGLEPSKPPDFTMPSSLNQESLSMKNEMNGGSLANSMQKSNGSTYKDGPQLSEKITQQILKESSSRYDDQACTSENTSHSSQQSNGHTKRNSLGEVNVTAPGVVPPAAADTKNCAETNQENDENSLQLFGLGHRLLIKSLHRKVSFDEKSGHYNSLKSVILEQSEQNSIIKQSHPERTFKEKVSFGYPIDSLPPSPPLEHMKISFQPLSGLETSKLKLQFPDGGNHHESIRDMFPSFQLVPESSIPLDDSGFYSDGDDTFCRSSPCASDDCHTPRSDDDSDQWDEIPESSDHDVHDSPHRSSSSASILSPKEHGRVSNNDTDITNEHMNGEPSLSGPLLDFPSFESVNPVLEIESNRHHECNNVMSHSYVEPTRPPPPPPAPPTQWRVTKPQLDNSNETQYYISEDAELISDRSLPESTIFQEPRLGEVEQIQLNHDGHESYDTIIHQLKEKLGPQKLNGQKNANQLRMGKEIDEKEDFLYQIRTKSFNLRPTVTGKSNATTGPTANVKVTAILEKANAIRQVVASDDGEDDDDTWSDT